MIKRNRRFADLVSRLTQTLKNDSQSNDELKSILVNPTDMYKFMHKNNLNDCDMIKGDRVDEFERIYQLDTDALKKKVNSKNWISVHVAAHLSALKIMQFILAKSSSNPGIINETDYKGNTPLHIAIANGHYDFCKLLLDNNCDVKIRNKESHAPIHYCVVSSQPKILELLLEHKNSVDIHYGGENSGTALHYCANLDDEECAKVLIKHGSDICVKCANGFFPIHLAAQRCSNKVLKFLFEEAAKHGCKKLDMLTFIDGDNNKPLHTAVQFGNVGAVCLCLDNGSRIDETIDVDHSTAVHAACAQGSLDILKLMFQKQPDLMGIVVHMQDINLMTPLHKAAMFDHVEVVEYLIECGSDIDAFDRERRSALLLAASRNSMNVVYYLIKNNADIMLRDAKMRNFLHLLADYKIKNPGERMEGNVAIDSTSLRNYIRKQGKQIDSSDAETLKLVITYIKDSEHLHKLMNEQDSDGCTVVHYASKFGYVHSVKALIKFGANISMKNHEKQSALHFAAKYGRYYSCVQILSSPNYKNYINEKDNNGCTPLHLAALNGHCKNVSLLMEKGALIYKAFNGNTPFHDAASNSYVNIMSLIFNVDPNVVDLTNKDGETALHLAAKEGHANVVDYLLNINAKFLQNKDGHTFLDLAITNKNKAVLLTVISNQRWQEALDLESKIFKAPLLGLIELSSEITQAALQRCIMKNETIEPDGKTIEINYVFKYLNYGETVTDKSGLKRYQPMLPLSHMVLHGRTNCLLHPLCQTMFHRKWDRYGFAVYGFSTLLYMLFVWQLTLMVISYPKCINVDKDSHIFSIGANKEGTINCTLISTNYERLHENFKNTHLYLVFSSFCILYASLSLLKNVYQIAIDKLSHVTSFQFYIEVILYITAIIFLIPFWTNTPGKLLVLDWVVGCITIFMAWFNFLLYLQRFYMVGIYVVMFIEVLRTLFKAISVFSILIVAFALVFYILFGYEEPRDTITPHVSIFRTIFMMVGEINGRESLIVPYTDDSPYTLYYGNTSIVFMVLFIVFVPILLTNLLIGLAVGDIGAVQKTARLKREAMQVQMYIEIESQMPKCILKRISEVEYKIVLQNNNQAKRNIFQVCCSILSSLEKSNEPNTHDEMKALTSELTMQSKTITSMRQLVDNQTELLKLIIKKMDMKNELEEDDHHDMTNSER